MAKRKSSTSETEPALAKVLPHEKLLQLEEERRWLLKQIRRKRTELDNFISQMRDLASELFQRSSGSLNEMKALDTEIHALFDEIFKRKFGKRSRRQIEQVYRNLQLQGVISVNPEFMKAFMDQDSDSKAGPADFFGEDFDPDFFNQAFPGVGEQGRPAAEDEEPSGSSAPSRDRAMRQTFLRLASVYHPDRAEDEDAQARNTEIMKEINQAYRSGDFARLLELEQQQDSDEPIEIDRSSESEVERECRRLERENGELSDQYEGIKQELRDLRNNTQEGVMVKSYRKAAKEGVDLVGELMEEAAAEVEMVEEIRDFVRDFRDRKMTIQEFVDGPGPNSPEEMIAAMEEMLGVTINFDPEIFR
ncbi:MAG: J domain-containing protein [Elainellaceae cyanobacterium]